MSKFYLYYSCIGFFVCLSASLVFSIHYKNIQGGIWASAGALMAGLCFFLHRLYFSNKLHYYFSSKSLDRLNVFSFIIVLIGSTFFVWYLFTMVYWKIPLFNYKITSVFPCVFSFITGKWGLHLYTTTKKYSEVLVSNYSPLFQSI